MPMREVGEVMGELAEIMKLAMAELERNKDKPCKQPPCPLDLAHVYERHTIYNESGRSGRNVSVCSKCGFESPLGVSWFVRAEIPRLK